MLLYLPPLSLFFSSPILTEKHHTQPNEHFTKLSTPWPPTPTVHEEVLSLGFSRTGTLTMVEAFKILGYPEPYHYSSIFANVKDATCGRKPSG